MVKTSAIRFVCKVVLFLYTVLFQAQNVSCQDLRGPRKIAIPFCIGIPGSLRTSQVIKITGIFFQPSVGTVIPAPWLNIILSSKCSSPQTPFYLRMQVENEVTVTGNSFENGHWGEEMSGKNFTLPSTGKFVLLIEIRSDGYLVTGNGVQLWTLPHRLNYLDVEKMEVRGASADISKIELIDQADPDAQRNTQIFYPVPLEEPISNPTFPFWGYIPGGLQVDKAIRIKGYFPNIPDRTRTAIDLLTDGVRGPIPLHIDIRFKFFSDVRRVVRNYYANGKWNPIEERDGPFPFKIGKEFTMLIQVQPECYNISVNGVPYWTYNHRIHFEEVTQVMIGGSPMVILDVAYIDTSEKKEDLEDSSGSSAAIKTIVHASQVYYTGICIFVFVLVNRVLQMM